MKPFLLMVMKWANDRDAQVLASESEEAEVAEVVGGVRGVAGRRQRMPPMWWSCIGVLAACLVALGAKVELPEEAGVVEGLREAGRVEAAGRTLEGLRQEYGDETWWRAEAGRVSLAMGLDVQAADALRAAVDDERYRGLRDRLRDLRVGMGEAADELGAARLERVPGLAQRWASLRDQPMVTAAGELAGLWADTHRMRSGVPKEGGGGEMSLWSAVDEYLRGLGEGQRGAVRGAVPDASPGDSLSIGVLQEDTPGVGSGGQRGMQVYRRWPWSEAGSRALLRYGEGELRAGRSGTARRAFEDVLSHAVDGDLPGRAEQGLAWLRGAGAGSGDGDDAPGDAGLPGELAQVLPPSGVRDYSLTGIGGGEGGGEGGEGEGGGRVVLTSATRLALYDAQREEPVWVRGPTVPVVSQGRVDAGEVSPRVLVAPPLPAVADGLIVTRWGRSADGGRSTGLAGFDVTTGAMRWWARPRRGDDGGELTPVGDPVLVEGRVYAAALDGRGPAAGVLATLHVLALDARTGDAVWSAPLATVPVGLAVQRRDPKDDPEAAVDLLHDGVALTVDRGAVYVATQAGMIARLDARDGLIEWAVPYRRGRLDEDSRAVLLARRGGAPVVVGDRLIVAPRDRHGVMALDTATGAMLWDRPWEASRRMLGRAGADGNSLVLLAGGEGVVAVDAATGERRWVREVKRASEASEGGEVEATLVGRVVWISDGQHVTALNAASGEVLTTLNTDADSPGQIESLAITGGIAAGAAGPDGHASDRVIVTRQTAVASPPPVRHRDAAATIKAISSLTHSPPTLTWTLPRIEPRIFNLDDPTATTTATTDSAATSDLLVWSRGLLERIDAADATPRWRRGLAHTPRDLLPLADRVILIHDDRLDALDTRTGQPAWSLRLTSPATRTLLVGNRLLLTHRVRNSRYDRGLTMVDPTDGHVLWRHDDLAKTPAGEVDAIADVYLHRATLYVAVKLGHSRGPTAVAALDPDTGTVRWARRVTPDDASGTDLTFHDAGGIATTRKARRLYRFTLTPDGVDITPDLSLPDRQKRGGPLEYDAVGARRGGDAVMVQLRNAYFAQDAQALFHLGDPEPRWVSRRTGGRFREDGRFELPDGRTLAVIDPDTGREMRYALPIIESLEHHPVILRWWQEGGGEGESEGESEGGEGESEGGEGGAMVVVSGMMRGPFPERVEPTSLRLDVFDLATGAHLRGGELPGVHYWRVYTSRGQGRLTEVDVLRETRVLRRGGGLIVNDYAGVHRLDPAAGGEVRPTEAESAEPGPATRRVAYQSPDANALTPAATDSTHPTLDVMHDSGDLLLTVRVPGDSLQPRRGEGLYGGGDWLQVMLGGPAGDVHLLAGLDDRGRPTFEPLGDHPVPPGVELRAELDVRSMMQVWRLRLPLKGVLPEPATDPREVAMSVTAWGELDGRLRPVASWGGTPIAVQTMPPDPLRVAVQPMTPDAEAAAIDLVRALPQVEGVREMFRRIAQPYQSDHDAATAFARRVLNPRLAGAESATPQPAAPADDLALLVLSWLDAAIRETPDPRPLDAVLAVARDAEASDAAVDAYCTLAGAHLSQWVWVEADEMTDPPRMLMLQVQDGGGDWDHRVSWGELESPFTGRPGTASRRLAGPMPLPGEWRELRVPLLWLGLHDRPIRGISFGRVGGGRVVWDDTAVVVGDRRWSLIDDEVPPDGQRQMKNRWEWVREPIHSGERAHAANPAQSPDAATHHDLYDLTPPFTAHLEAPGTADRDAPSDPAAANATLATLERLTPRLGDSDAAIDALRALQSFDGDDAQNRIDRVTWFARTLPSHPRLPEVLGGLLQHLRDAGDEDARATLEKLLDAAKVPAPVRYAYHRRYTHPEGTPLDRWLVVGPFEGGLEVPLAPELAAITPDAEYAAGGAGGGGGGGGTRQPFTAEAQAGVVQLAPPDATPRPGVTYAAATLTPKLTPTGARGRAAVLELRAPAPARVYLNARPVWSSSTGDDATDATIPLYLRAGDNTLLVKLADDRGDAYLHAQLFQPDGRGGIDLQPDAPQ